MFINNMQANVFYGYRQGLETVASAFPFFHIGGAAVLFNAIRTASTFLVFPDPRNVEQMCNEMRANTPTVIAAVPALFQMLVADERFRALDFSQLLTVVSGAAPFTEEEIKRLESVVGQGVFCEVYGMTETSPVQTLNPAQKFKPGFVGVPLPGTDLMIVDTENGTTELPLGEAGEVIVAGPQVMQGYLAAPEANAKALREHDGKIWMHTGDIGYLDRDGYLKICDRSKDMLIVGGYKVFSVEVEAKLSELPFVAMSAVVGRPDQSRPGNEVVQVYIQRRPGTLLSETEQREAVVDYCRANMAPYKVPKEIFFVDAIPLTSVGKIDKKALRAAS
jgi:long-chain acyl-CoA synthetase